MMTRQDKKREKALRLRHFHQRRQDQCIRALNALGLGDGFRSLGAYARDVFTSYCRPFPEFNTNALGPLARQLKERTLADLSNAVVSVGDAEVNWPDAYCVLAPLINLFCNARINCNGGTRQERRFVEQAKQVCLHHASLGEATFSMMEYVLLLAAAGTSEFDRRLVWLKASSESSTRRSRIFEFRVEPPQQAWATIEGAARPVYRCGGWLNQDGIGWVDWPGNLVGGDANRRYPVYIQRHALDRLMERLRPMSHRVIQHSLLCSLDNPIVVRGHGDDQYLVDFRLGTTIRSGYLTACRLTDKIVITTFLFLTMQGTPEARRLANRLRLRRPDIEYTGLDHLAGFINSDLANDPELAPILNDSGCRGLLDLKFEGCSARPVKAADLRHYLGLKPSVFSKPVVLAASPHIDSMENRPIPTG